VSKRRRYYDSAGVSFSGSSTAKASRRKNEALLVSSSAKGRSSRYSTIDIIDVVRPTAHRSSLFVLRRGIIPTKKIRRYLKDRSR